MSHPVLQVAYRLTWNKVLVIFKDLKLAKWWEVTIRAAVTCCHFVGKSRPSLEIHPNEAILQLTNRVPSFTWLFSTVLLQLATRSITCSHRRLLLRDSRMQNSSTGIWNSKRSGIFIEVEISLETESTWSEEPYYLDILLTLIYPVRPIPRSILKLSPNLWLLLLRSIVPSGFPIVLQAHLVPSLDPVHISLFLIPLIWS